MLSKQDRISMSKKIVDIPEENAIVDNVKLQILAKQQQAIKNDEVNAKLQLPYTNIINLYQPEFNHIDGKKRTELTEAMIESAAKGEPNNGFFLANPNTPTPTVPDGVWKAFSPMSFCYAIGAGPLETYPVEPLGEEPAIAQINSLITQIETYAVSARATGSQCVTAPNPSPPPANTTTLVALPAIQTLLTNLKSQVTTWKGALNAQKSVIVLSETVATRLAQNQAAYNAIDPVIPMLVAWEALIDFNAAGSCPLSESWGSYGTNKLHPNGLQMLKDTITYRNPFLTTRKAQLNSYFGSIAQSPTGEISSATGWYGERFLIIDSRLNIISGSANGKYGAEKAIATQNQVQASNTTTAMAYDLTMKATKAVAPGLDTNYLNVQDASIFNVGDRIYVVANNQEELSGSIEEKNGNRLKLTFKVPKKYTLGNQTRVYKLVEKIL